MKTYLFSGDSGYDWSYFREILHQNGYAAYPDGEYVQDGQLLLKDGACGISYVDFLSVEMIPLYGFDKNTYSINCDWHSRHIGDSVRKIVRKDMLHEYLKGTPYIAETCELGQFTYTDGVYILRPSHLLLSSGIDILIVDSPQTWDAAKEFYEKKAAAHASYHGRSLQYYKVIVSRYIDRPLLIGGRKFHIRLYGINLDGKKFFKISPHGKILTAAKPFQMADFSNKEIHDTHIKSTDRDYLYPDDFPAPEMVPDISRQLGELEQLLAEACIPEHFAQAKRSFNWFGLDVMVEESGKIVLLEINDRTGYDPIEHGEAFAKLCRIHAQWLADILNIGG